MHEIARAAGIYGTFVDGGLGAFVAISGPGAARCCAELPGYPVSRHRGIVF